ncbi:MAG: hypothetical protein LBL41_00915 [Bifidobacteriaceae bacterium]|jgi:DNA polymerase-1|nr:hypothetical protein [Bifidobacteriaceae bacterium]
MQKKLLLIDGHSMAFRAYYGLNVENFISQSGVATNAVYGFFSMLSSLVTHQKPTHIAVAFDVSRVSFRTDMLPEYKGTRGETPKEFIPQVPIIKEILDALKIEHIERENYEADDILATLSTLAKRDDYDVLISSGDRDVFQLIDTNVSILYPIKGVKTIKLMKAEDVLEKYGVLPETYPDLAALVGEKSDNIPGVPGVGPKFAAKWLQTYGSLRGIVNHKDEIDGTRGQALRENLDQVLLNREVNALVRDMEFDKNVLETLQFGKEPPDIKAYQNVCKRYEFSDFTIKHTLKALNINSDASDIAKSQDITPETDATETTATKTKNNTKDKTVDDADFDFELAAYVLNPGNSRYDIISLYEQYGATSNADLQNIMLSELEKRNQLSLFNDIERPLAPLLQKMHETGIAVDKQKMLNASEDLKTDIDLAENTVNTFGGTGVNLRSPKQLQKLLFDDLNMPKTKKIKTGYTTDSSALNELFAKTAHPLLKAILLHRELTKDKQIIDGLLESVRSDGKIHTTFMQTVTATGRLSSINPNLQNIPQKRESAEKMRTAFVPSDGYDYLLSADYSQIEMRVMADMSGDENLISAFRSGEDLHKYIASKVYNVPLQQVTPAMRSNAKGVSYGLAYGLSVYGLSQNLKITVQDATQITNNYLARFSKVKHFLNSLVQLATETGYTETKFGRRRYIPTLTSDIHALREAARRAALNAPIQGTAADIMKIAMLNVNNELIKNNLKSRLLLQIHDELILEVPADELEIVRQLTLDKMQTATKLSVPLDVSVGYGRNWHEAAH